MSFDDMATQFMKKEEKEFSYIIREKGTFRMWWDYLIILLSILDSFIVPLDISFSKELSEVVKEGRMKSLLQWIDVVNVIDIILNCRTTYTNRKAGLEIFKPKKLLKHYLSSLKFYLDLVAVLPFDSIIVGMMGADIDPKKLQYVSMVKLTRILRIKKQILQLNIREI